MKQTVYAIYGDVSVIPADEIDKQGRCALEIGLHGTFAVSFLTAVQARKVASLLIEEADRMDGLIPQPAEDPEPVRCGNCGTYRTVRHGGLVLRCTKCGDDEYVPGLGGNGGPIRP